MWAFQINDDEEALKTGDGLINIEGEYLVIIGL